MATRVVESGGPKHPKRQGDCEGIMPSDIIRVQGARQADGASRWDGDDVETQCPGSGRCELQRVRLSLRRASPNLSRRGCRRVVANGRSGLAINVGP